MFRNRPGQTIRVFAFAKRLITIGVDTYSTGDPVLGIANTITLRLSKNGGATFNSQQLNPTETEDGYYLFAITKSETDAQTLDPYPESSIDGVQVIAPNFDRQLVLLESESNASVITTNNYAPEYYGGGAAGIGELFVDGPVLADGTIREAIVKNTDYLAANNRAFAWIVHTSFIPSSCSLTFWRDTGNVMTISGVAVGDGDVAALSFDVSAADTASLTPGEYEYIVEMTDGVGHIVPLHSLKSQTKRYLRLIDKRT